MQKILTTNYTDNDFIKIFLTILYYDMLETIYNICIIVIDFLLIYYKFCLRGILFTKFLEAIELLEIVLYMSQINITI